MANDAVNSCYLSLCPYVASLSPVLLVIIVAFAGMLGGDYGEAEP
jgi:hypothetical protein